MREHVGASDGYYSTFWPRTVQAAIRQVAGRSDVRGKGDPLPLLCWEVTTSLAAFFFLILLAAIRSLCLSTPGPGGRARYHVAVTVSVLGTPWRSVTRAMPINRKRGCVVGCTKREVEEGGERSEREESVK
jgi:hypothetical protein